MLCCRGGVKGADGRPDYPKVYPLPRLRFPTPGPLPRHLLRSGSDPTPL